MATINKTRNLLYLLLSLPVIVNLLLIYYHISFNRYYAIVFEALILVIVFVVAKRKNILNWSSLLFAFSIALLITLIELFR